MIPIILQSEGFKNKYGKIYNKFLDKATKTQEIHTLERLLLIDESYKSLLLVNTKFIKENLLVFHNLKNKDENCDNVYDYIWPDGNNARRYIKMDDPWNRYRCKSMDYLYDHIGVPFDFCLFEFGYDDHNQVMDDDVTVDQEMGKFEEMNKLHAAYDIFEFRLFKLLYDEIWNIFNAYLGDYLCKDILNLLINYF